MSVMTVEYFCMGSRPDVGAKIEYEYEDMEAIKALLYSTNTESMADFCSFVEKGAHNVDINASLLPARGEYQNFGILAALDVLNAIRDAVVRYHVDINNIIIIGGSYGGYIANLVTKIIPGYIRAVFDNSSWANPNLQYVVGREYEGVFLKPKYGDASGVRGAARLGRKTNY